MFGIGLPELIVIFLVIVMLFGAKALPEIARSLGEAMKIFKRESDGILEDKNKTSENPDQKNNQSEKRSV